MEKLKKLQKPASVQIDKRVDARVDSKMDSTVTYTVQHILVDNLNPMAFKKNGSRNTKRNRDLVWVIKNTSLVKVIKSVNKLLEAILQLFLFLLHQLLQPLTFFHHGLCNLLTVGLQTRSKTFNM